MFDSTLHQIKDQSHKVGSIHSEHHTVRLTEALKSKIHCNIKRFDIYALLDLLKLFGINETMVSFDGHFGFESQPSLLKDIHFGTDGHVYITLYMGLAGAQSVLPSYFFNAVEKGVLDEAHFYDLIGFFNQYLLKSWVHALHPVGSFTKFSPHKLVKSMGNFTSLSNLRHLFQIVLPELQVRCERFDLVQAKESKPCVLGTSKIGLEMILGDQFNIMGYGHRVNLISDGEVLNGQSWHSVALLRIREFIFPLLSDLDLHIDIWLIIRDSTQWVSLSDQRTTLGFERFKGHDLSAKEIRLHTGPILTQPQ